MDWGRVFVEMGERYTWASPKEVARLSYQQLANYMGWGKSNQTGRAGGTVRMPAAEARRLKKAIQDKKDGHKNS